VDSGLNRDLIIDLFREAKIAEKILHTQQVNERIRYDSLSALLQQCVDRICFINSGGQRSKRLALMGHMLLIADEIEKFLERCPMALYSEIQDTFVRSEWDAFVLGELRESRQRDAQPLGGGRPSPATLANAARQAEMEDLEEEDETNGAFAGQPLTRATSSGEAFSNSFGFGTPDTEEGRYRNVSKSILSS
jgi:SIT4-associating protein SAP185/190